jgi:crotonobetainyl-CoA:carnitine CoA-transferase CaiB-like acyl-CoA transferase
MESGQPLIGLRVLAVEQYGAGPFGTQFLADMGAEVIKIENCADGGDVGRSVGPHFLQGVAPDQASLFFHSFNRNKKSICLDLASDEGRRALQALAAGADGLVCNLRGDVPAQLGLTYESLCVANPRIVCAHLTGYGRDGSRAHWPGYDYLMQAEAGYFALTGDPDGPPARMGLSVIDMMAGTLTALGLLAAILAARESGTGRNVDVSLFDVAMFHLSYIGAWSLGAGVNPAREQRSAHPSLTPCQTYKTRDGWIYLMCNKEKFWPRLCELVGRPEWSKDPRFARFADRTAHRALLTGMLDEVLSIRTTAQWLASFGGKIPAAPILDVAQALANPFVSERGLVREADLGNGMVSLLASPIRAGTLPAHDRAGPSLGAHTAELLGSLDRPLAAGTARAKEDA